MKHKKTIRLVCFGAAMSILFSACAFTFILHRELDPAVKAETSLFVPTRGLADDKPLRCIRGIRGVETNFECNGKKLNGWYYRNPKSDKVVLMSHGNAFNVGFVGTIGAIDGLLRCDQSVFAYDYAGYGRSEGLAGTKSATESVVAAYDHLRKDLHYKPEQINAVGVSLGAAITAQLMARRQLNKVVLVSGFTSPRAVALDISPLFAVYPARSFEGVGLATINLLKQTKVHPPILFMHGKDDQLIHVHEAQENFDATSEPKSILIFKNSDHMLPAPADQKDFLEAVKKFLN